MPASLTKQPGNQARPSHVTEGCIAELSNSQLGVPAQGIADCIENLTSADSRSDPLPEAQNSRFAPIEGGGESKTDKTIGSACPKTP